MTEVLFVLAATAGAVSFACSPSGGASPKMEWSMPPEGKQSIFAASKQVDSPFKHPFAFTSRNADNICWTKPLARRLGGRASWQA
jgi:hypothetical protein